jgi:hypothetical protein
MMAGTVIIRVRMMTRLTLPVDILKITAQGVRLDV